MAPAPTPRHHVTSGRYDVHWLRSGQLTLGVVPALGGRLLSAQIDRRELLWRNPDLLDDDLQPRPGHVPTPAGGMLGDWHNYGGDKTWPAPQGWSSAREWAGPPDPVLDSGPYDAEVTTLPDAVCVTVTSAADPRTGLRLSRRFRLADEDGFDLRITAVNASDHEVTWALWNVTQLAGGGVVEIAVDERFTDPVELAIGTGTPDWERVTAEAVRIPSQDVVGKLGFPHAAGQITYRRDDLTVTWNFEVDNDASYPDGGSRAEVWLEHPQPAPLATLDGLDPPDRIVECEVLSPSRTLGPGQSTTLDLSVDVRSDHHHQETP